MLKVLNVLQVGFNARPAVNMGTLLTSLCYKKKISFRSRNPKVHQLQVGVVYVQEDSICSQSSDLTSRVKIQCTQGESKFPTPHHLITNLAY